MTFAYIAAQHAFEQDAAEEYSHERT
jgi:hypothetical protein